MPIETYHITPAEQAIAPTSSSPEDLVIACIQGFVNELNEGDYISAFYKYTTRSFQNADYIGEYSGFSGYWSNYPTIEILDDPKFKPDLMQIAETRVKLLLIRSSGANELVAWRFCTIQDSDTSKIFDILKSESLNCY